MPSHEPAGEGRNEILTRRFRDTDWPAVVSTLDAAYGTSEARPAVYEHWNLRCPVAESGFVVAELEGRVVGVQPMLIHDWAVGGMAVRGGVLTGVVVDPGFRRRGVFSALVRASEAEAWSRGAEFIVTMPNDRSHPGFLRLGWTDLGPRSLLIRHPFVSRSASREVEVRDDVPEDIAELSELHGSCFSGLTLQRTLEWWRWRFRSPGPTAYLQVVMRGSTGSTVGVAAGVIRRSRGIPIGYLVDFLASSQNVLVRLARGLTRALVSVGALGMVSVVSSPSVVAALRPAGFLKAGHRMPVKAFHTVARFKPGPGALSEKLAMVSAWNLTLGDWDNI
jgi:GNAT superfamily N-acetyltransferase